MKSIREVVAAQATLWWHSPVSKHLLEWRITARRCGAVAKPTLLPLHRGGASCCGGVELNTSHAERARVGDDILTPMDNPANREAQVERETLRKRKRRTSVRRRDRLLDCSSDLQQGTTGQSRRGYIGHLNCAKHGGK